MFDDLVVALDGSACAQRAFDLALALTRTLGSRLVVCSVAGAVPALAQGESEAQLIVGDAVARARADGIATRECVELGEPANQIVGCAARHRAGAIVIGTHGRSGIKRMLVGSVAEGVLRSARIPVFIVREEARIAPLASSILAPVDGSDTSTKALDAATELAATLGAELVICHVVDLAKAAALSGGEAQLVPGSLEILQSDGREILARACERAARRAKVSSRSAEGMPVEEIERLAGELRPALIAIGSHGRSGLERVLMGSVAEGVVRSAPVPVMVVPR
ncbi:MAG: universal stress protein [Candidatus Baltobacteraceae bacterium]